MYPAVCSVFYVSTHLILKIILRGCEQPYSYFRLKTLSQKEFRVWFKVTESGQGWI